MTQEKVTQNKLVLDYMITHGSITQFEANEDLGVSRLSARICDLRRMGHNITENRVPVKNRRGTTCRVSRYRLISDEVMEQ